MADHLTFDLAHWVGEREAMRMRKEQPIPPPWTADPTMASTRWCNVHREDDKVTRWMHVHWRGHTRPLWWSVAGRMINYIPSLEALLEADSPGRAAGILKQRRAAGEKIWTSAYTISTCGKKLDKIDYVLNQVCQEVRRHSGGTRLDRLRHTYTDLLTIDGLGSFLAGQVVADLKNTPRHPLQDAPDWHTWCSPGPGSLRGLNWYFGGAAGAGVTVSNFQKHIDQCYEETMPYVPSYVGRIHMQDFQNCLCEFGKYMKIKTGAGHARNRYIAG